MFLKSLDTDKVFDSPLSICEGPASPDSREPWITVLVGTNGCKKSLALRLLMEAGLGRRKYNGHGHPPIKFSANFPDGMPSNVIAISNTPWDRFPRGYELGKLSRLLFQDAAKFVYIGQRAGTGNVSLRNNEIQLGYSLVENSARLGELANELGPIFSRLGLEVAAGIRLRRGKGVGISRAGLRAGFSEDNFRKHLSLLPRIVNAIKRDRSISGYSKACAEAFAASLRSDSGEVEKVRALLKSIHPSKIAFWLRPREQRIFGGYGTILEWRSLLYLGLVDIDGVSLLSLGNSELVELASKTKRESDLSSGQWNWLYNFSNLVFELRDNSLVLVDEPENSLHPAWQRAYIPALRSVLSAHEGCHAVIASHSVLIASGLSAEWGNIQSLIPDARGDGKVSIQPIASPFARSADDVCQEVFGMDSSRAPEFIEAVDQLLAVLSRGGVGQQLVSAEAVSILARSLEHLPPYDAMRNVVAAILRNVEHLGVVDE